MNPQLTVAHKSVSRIGRLITQVYDQTAKLNQAQRADEERFVIFYKQIESEIAKDILEAYPEHTVDTKYAGVKGTGKGNAYWYVSGMVGKESFKGNSIDFSISIAYLVDDKLIAALVYKPISQIAYMAVKGEGSIANDVRIRFPKHSGKLDDALLMTDSLSLAKGNIAVTSGLQENSLGVSVLGDSALAICEAVEGKASAVWLTHFNAHDHYASLLIAQEGGALATDFSGKEIGLNSTSLVLTTPKLLKPLLQFIHQSND